MTIRKHCPVDGDRAPTAEARRACSPCAASVASPHRPPEVFPMAHATQMSAADTGLLVIDLQEKLLPLIPDAAAVVRNAAFLIDAAMTLGMTVQATEQYPRGLGPTA